VGTWALPEGIPAVVARGAKLDLFAIGQGGLLSGGPLVHWRFDGSWSVPEAHDASLAAGGVGAVHGVSGLDAFAFGTNNSLQHWPPGSASRRTILGKIGPAIEGPIPSRDTTIRPASKSWSRS